MSSLRRPTAPIARPVLLHHYRYADSRAFGSGDAEAPKARFTNIIDSHYNPTHPPSSDTPAAAALPDEASFTLLPSGETLEAGTMLHPRTLLPTPYEEIWAPVPVERGSHVVILRSLFTQDEDRGRAFVGMCGDWAMGVYEIDTEGRGGFGGWKARRGEKKEGGWECVWESSGGETRRGWVGSWCADEGGEWEGWREGDKIRLGKEGEGKWEVLEHSLFGEGRPK